MTIEKTDKTERDETRITRCVFTVCLSSPNEIAEL